MKKYLKRVAIAVGVATGLCHGILNISACRCKGMDYELNNAKNNIKLNLEIGINGLNIKLILMSSGILKLKNDNN